MKAKLEKILRKKFPKYTPAQIAAEVERRIPTPADLNAEPPMDLAALIAEAEAMNAEFDATTTTGVDDDRDIDSYDDLAAPSTDPVAPTGETEEPAPVEAKGDDLTKIRGIGKKLQVKLSELGVTTFQELADMTPSDIDTITEQLDFKGRITFEDWIVHATELAN